MSRARVGGEETVTSDHVPGSPVAGPVVPASEGRGEPQGLVVAVDGPGGSGKSTVAREIARRLRLRYLDTGAMYRAVTQLALDRRVDLEDAEAIGELAARAVLTVGTDADAPTIAVDGVDVAAAIRTRAVTNAVSAVAAVPAVRTKLVARQQQIIAAAAQSRGIVVEGRDIGSVVVPDAPVKVFLTASMEVRALRRSQQLGEKGVDDLARTLAELDRRDSLDKTRSADPLSIPPDAVQLDSSELSVDAVVKIVLDHCEQVLAATP